jgi:uncharacterized protein YjbI with pentapeptide repeats
VEGLVLAGDPSQHSWRKGTVTDATPNFGSDSPREVNFEGQTVTDCDFGGMTFEKANFKGATFTEGANFDGATFTDEASFEGATFAGAPSWASFLGATFTEGANFEGATFTEGVIFQDATFTDEAEFGGATFTHVAFFRGATFTKASFRGATFTQWADFSGATFTHMADFEGATFTEGANFEGATFTDEADFVNAEMKAETFFRGASFASSPPRFFGAKLHEGTVWRDVIWPDPPKNPREAGGFVDAYERLKLEMDRLKKHGDELDFFARELQCRRVLQGTWGGFPIAVYGFLSDYGRSYTRPLALLLATIFIGVFFYAAHLVGFWTPLLSDLDHTGEAIGISFGATLSLLVQHLVDFDSFLKLPVWLKTVAAIQTALGLVLLFLFGLGIRNRFRMK